MSVFDTPLILIYSLLLAFFIGTVMGSFLNCTAMRIAHGESFLKGRSHCMHCGHTLSALDLVPLFSWLFLKGRCRYCKEPVSARYPLTELIMGTAAVLCLLNSDFSLITIRNFGLISCLFLVSLTDLEIMEIPNGALIAAILLWVLYLPFSDDLPGMLRSGLVSAVIFGGGLLLVSLVMDKVLGKESLGGGDIKLVFVTALYLGSWRSLFMLFTACVLGLLFSFITKKGKEKQVFAFGPFLAGAAVLALLYGDALVSRYLSLF